MTQSPSLLEWNFYLNDSPEPAWKINSTTGTSKKKKNQGESGNIISIKQTNEKFWSLQIL